MGQKTSYKENYFCYRKKCVETIMSNMSLNEFLATTEHFIGQKINKW